MRCSAAAALWVCRRGHRGPPRAPRGAVAEPKWEQIGAECVTGV